MKPSRPSPTREPIGIKIGPRSSNWLVTGGKVSGFDVGVDIAATASDIRIENNRFEDVKIAVRDRGIKQNG